VSGVLEGVRVVDLGHYVAGPLTAVLLADQGADVIRIDRPGAVDSERDVYLQRRKRRITLDLKDPEDVAVARRLITSSDVLVENFRPGVMERLGISATRLREVNPRLVYCALPGFAAADPRASLPAWEGIIAAATGNCRVRVGEAPPGWEFARPVYSMIPMASNFSAMLAAYGIVSALARRHRTGHGEYLEVPLFNAMFELIGGAGAYPVADGFALERPLNQMGSGTYECRDGRFVQFNPIGANARFLRWLADVAGEQGWAAEGLTSLSHLASAPGALDELRSRLRKLFASKPAQVWEDLANSVGVPLCMVRSSAEWAYHQHAVMSEQVQDVVDPEFGPVRSAGRPIHVSAGDIPLGVPRHLPDADRTEVLAAASEAVASFDLADRDSGALPYDGMKVIDLTQILAGPTAGRMLGEFGAEVIKINAPQRRVAAHGLVNRGKQSILLDLESMDGQEVLWKLIESADVVTLNFPKATAERYGLGYQHVRARKPDIVYLAVSCYGDNGPWVSRRGYEVQGQAATGVMDRVGGSGRPAVLGPYNLLDYGTGAMAAYGAALGIYHRLTSGEGTMVSASLAQSGVFQQATLSMLYEGKPTAEMSGRELLGESVLQRYYRAADGWFFLAAAHDDLDGILDALGLRVQTSGPDTGPDSPLATQIAAVFAAHDVEHWTGLLSGPTIAVQRVTSLEELMTDPAVASLGLSVRQHSPEVGEVVLPGIPFVIGSGKIRPGRAAPQPGADGRSVLETVGLADHADALQRAWVVQLDNLPTGWDAVTPRAGQAPDRATSAPGPGSPAD
jgi:crotonobetainyl-CoA:carnitine CoA-transferase CaiB-like acyl-CoA transferase